MSGAALADIYNSIVIDNCNEGPDTAKKLTVIDREVVLFELRCANALYWLTNKQRIQLKSRIWCSI